MGCKFSYKNDADDAFPDDPNFTEPEPEPEGDVTSDGVNE